MAGVVAADPGLSSPGRAPRRDLVAIALLVVVGLRLAVALGGANRGLEMGDEGYFLLNLNQPEAAIPPLEIYRLIGALTGGSTIGVVAARLLRVVCELAGSLVLVLGVLRWARARWLPDEPGARAGWIALALQGTLLTVASRSLGYNDLTNLFSFSAVGCLFFLAATGAGEGARRLGLALATGALIALQLATKFPPAALLVALVAGVVGLALHALSRGERLRLLAACAASFAATGAAIVAITGGPAPLLERLAIARQLPALTKYDPLALLRRYLWLDQLTFLNLGVFALAFGAAWAFARRGSARGAERPRAAAFLFAALVLVASVARWHPNFLRPSLVYVVCLGIGATLCLLAVSLVEWRPGAVADPASPRERVLLLLVLLVLPLVEIAGTNVPVTMRLPTHFLPIVLLLALLVAEARPAGRGPLQCGVALALALAGGVVFVRHHWLEPYGLRAPLHQQASEVEGLPGVRVDFASARFLETVATTLREAGMQRGDPVIALDYMPGLVHFVGGTSPRFNLYMFDLSEYDCFNLGLARLPERVFFVLAREPDQTLQRCLATLGFPERFERLRTLRFPYQEAYVHFGVADFSHVELYGPRRSGPGGASGATAGGR